MNIDNGEILNNDEILGLYDAEKREAILDTELTEDELAELKDLVGKDATIILAGEKDEAPAKKAAKKKMPKKKTAAPTPPPVDEEEDGEEVALPRINSKFGDKDDRYVRELHEASWDEFCKVYGVLDDVEKRDIADVVKTDKEDLRYPAKRTTCLTRRAI